MTRLFCMIFCIPFLYNSVTNVEKNYNIHDKQTENNLLCRGIYFITTLIMNNKSINSNKQFMIETGYWLSGILYRMSFLYLGFRNQSKSNDKGKTFAGIYTVEIADSFTGDSLSVYINDSLLFNSNIGDAAVKFQVKRFAKESTLMVVDNHTDEITPLT